MRTTIEICCVGLKDCIHAQNKGADRIELCASMAAEGLTPSFGLFQLVKEKCTIPVMVMLRPRGAGFCYNDIDYEVMLKDAKIFLEAGADGLVFGIVNEQKEVDTKRVSELCELIHSYGKEAVFHRAFDSCPNKEKAIEELIACGVDRILTSGGPGNAMEYLDVLKAWELKYGKQIQFQACGSIREENAQDVIKATNIHQIHSACRTFVQDPSDAKAENLDYSNAYDKVCATKCENLVKVIRELEA